MQKPLRLTSTVIQYCALIYLEKADKEVLVSDLSGILDVKINLLINELQALLYNPLFNKGKLANSGVISANIKNGEDITEKTLVGINKKFFPQIMKISTIQLMVKKTKTEENDEKEKDQQMLINSQNFVLDACITRIMKGRIGKETKHLELVNETARQIELFVAQPIQIKGRIESLIEKGIIQRKENSYDKYEYIS